MDSVAVRELPPFAPTLKVTVPTPMPVAPFEIVTQETGLVAVHWGQPVGEFTCTVLRVCPPGPNKAPPDDKRLLQIPCNKLTDPANGNSAV
jgi:hypothetical protein